MIHRRLLIFVIVSALHTFSCKTEALANCPDNMCYVAAEFSGRVLDDPLGSATNPFASLAEVEAASSLNDTIFVLPAPLDVAPLDGGIELKSGQQLIGLGDPGMARIGNSDSTRLLGDAIRVADNTLVENIIVDGAHRGGIVGFEVANVTINASTVTNFNASKTTDLTRPSYSNQAPVGGIHLYQQTVGDFGTTSVVDSRVIHGPEGIVMVHAGEARGTLWLEGNQLTDIDNIAPTPGSPAVVGGAGVRFFQFEDSDVDATLKSTFIDRVGYGNLVAATSSNSDKINVFAEQRSQLDLTIDDYVVRNSTGLGNASSTGMELAVGLRFEDSDGVNLKVTVTDADIRNQHGAGIQLLDFGNNSDVSLEVRDSIIENTIGSQGASIMHVRAGRNASWGVGNAKHKLVVENSELRGAERANIELLVSSFSSSAVTHTLDSWDAVIRGNVLEGSNDGIALVNGIGLTNDSSIPGTTIGKLDLLVEGNLIQSADRAGIRIVDNGTIVGENFDFGGGALGSTGNNRILGSGLHEAIVENASVSARNNWWGSAELTDLRFDLIPDGSIEVEPIFLAGDYTQDGLVNGADFLAWQRGESPNPLGLGDLADWQAHYGDVTRSTALSPIPEPSSTATMIAAILLLLAVPDHIRTARNSHVA